jgi:hypothetical protein
MVAVNLDSSSKNAGSKRKEKEGKQFEKITEQSEGILSFELRNSSFHHRKCLYNT